MPPALIDTHAHLDDARFDADRGDVLARAREAGVERVLTVGIDLATSRAAVELAQEWPGVFAVVGIQPNHVAEARDGDFDEIERLAALPRVVAVGETGLDRYWDRAPFALQQDYFRRHLAFAHRIGKPVVIHCREAEADLLVMLEEAFAERGPVRGVLHSFSGDLATAERGLELGLHVSFAGMVTYKSAQNLRGVAARVPADRLLVETDSPYLAPVPRRGQRNEPGLVAHTAACLAEARGETLEGLARQTTANAAALFGLGAD